MVISFGTTQISSREECVSYAQSDLWAWLEAHPCKNNAILSIDKLFIEQVHRRKGLGTHFLKNFCEEHKKQYVLLVVAGFLQEEKENPSELEVQQKLIQLEKFYTAVGFINVNDFIGQYEYKTVYLYNGGVGKTILSQLTRK